MSGKVQVIQITVTGERHPEDFKIEGTEAVNSNGTKRIALDPQQDIFFSTVPRQFNTFEEFLRSPAPLPDKDYRKPSLLNPGRNVPKVLVEEGNGFCISDKINFREWEHKADMIDQRGMDEAIFRLGRKAYSTDTMTKIALMLAGSSVLMVIILVMIVAMTKLGGNSEPANPDSKIQAEATAVLVP